MDKLNNKRFFVNVMVGGLSVSGVCLARLMNYYIGVVERTYIAEEGVFAYPNNIGFRWSSLLGMVATIMFQLALFMLCYCQKEWRLFAWSSGWLIDSIIVYRLIASTSRTQLFWKLQDQGYMVGIGYVRYWSYITAGICGLLALMVSVGFYRWFVGNGNRGDKINKYFAVLITVIGIMMLILRAFTNVWYIVLCVVSSVLSWYVLGLAEKRWHRQGLDDSLPREPDLLDIFMDFMWNALSFTSLDDEDYDLEDDLYDDLDMSKYTLDLLIDFSKQLDKEPFDDYTKKEYMFRMIRRLRESYDKYEEDGHITGDVEHSYSAKIISFEKYRKDK